jgi:peptide/nickel transport system permease protein
MIDPTVGDFSPERIEAERESLGLNDPLPIQYFNWLGRIIRGDLGYSIILKKPIASMISVRLWPTLKITLLALILSAVFGISLGVLSAVKQYSLVDYLSTFLSFLSVSLPGFFIALGMVFLFALKLDWLPTSGMSTLGGEKGFIDSIKYMVMPVAVLTISGAAPLVRYARSSMLECLKSDYMVLARAKGAKKWRAIYVHAFPNALIPLLTVIGLRIPALFAGAIIIEQIFHWQGLGTLNIWAVMNQDYSVLMALNLVAALMVLGANLLTDIAYALVDPRIKLS